MLVAFILSTTVGVLVLGSLSNVIVEVGLVYATFGSVYMTTAFFLRRADGISRS